MNDDLLTSFKGQDMGRPPFKIDQLRLRTLRNEQGLTQIAIVRQVAGQLGLTKPESRVRHYQRIEETGKTSARYASALASVLKVSLPLLQGQENPDPYSYLQHIQGLLKDQLDAGTNTATQKAFAEYQYGEEDALTWFAQDIAAAIEQALLVRNPARIAGLIEMTGLTEEELLAPANARGLWFISARSRGINITEVIDDVSSVNYRLGEIFSEFLGSRAEDSTVRMWRDDPWIRIELYRPCIRDRMQIDLTRFQPSATGLSWIKASWQDDFFLEPAIIDHAFDMADVVTDFSGKTSPGDPHRLRLIVTEYDWPNPAALRRMIVRSDIEDLPDTTKESFAKECYTRILFVNWLTAALRRALIPHLAACPNAKWYVDTLGNSVEIKIENPRFRGRSLADPRYRIMLAEEVAPGTFSRVPVREKDMEILKSAIEGWLSEDHVPSDDNDLLPDFETI